tara:strand:- start:131 stop:796 length:666 start_codon:yes stop_codon:yes gene_type:complete
MSSSAALASAKKRRVEQGNFNPSLGNRRIQNRVRPQQSVRQQPQQQVRQPQQSVRQPQQQVRQQVNVSNNSNDKQPVKKKLTPLEALTSHDKRLDRIEDEFPQAVEQINENISILSENMESFKSLSTKVTNLEKVVDKENSDENIAFFRNKVENMEKELVDIKALFLKMQSFAMETNLTLMKYKNGMDAKLATEVSKKHEDDKSLKTENVQLKVDEKTKLK